jgi:hypothetical protein
MFQQLPGHLASSEVPSRRSVIPRKFASQGYIAMKKITCLIFFMTLMPSVAIAGWSRMSQSTIKFQGSVEKNSYQEYLNVSKGGFKNVILQSGGGYPSIALRIAQDIARHKNISIKIDGYCASACANYMALSGSNLDVGCDSIIGFHGTLPDERESYKELDNEGAPPELAKAYADWVKSFHHEEDIFFKSKGINKEILYDSGEAIKSLKIKEKYNLDQDTGEYSYTTTAAIWIPTNDALKYYGVKGLHYCPSYSNQSVDAILHRYGLNIAYTISNIHS